MGGWVFHERRRHCSDRMCGADDCSTCRGDGPYYEWVGDGGPTCTECCGDGIVIWVDDNISEECMFCAGKGWVDPDLCEPDEVTL